MEQNQRKKEQRNSKEYKNNEKVLNKQLFRKKRNMDEEERERVSENPKEVK